MPAGEEAAQRGRGASVRQALSVSVTVRVRDSAAQAHSPGLRSLAPTRSATPNFFERIFKGVETTPEWEKLQTTHVVRVQYPEQVRTTTRQRNETSKPESRGRRTPLRGLPSPPPRRQEGRLPAQPRWPPL